MRSSNVQAWACPKIELYGGIPQKISSFVVVLKNKTLCNFLVTYSRVIEHQHSLRIVVFAKSKPLCIVSRTAFRKLVKNGLKVTV